MTEPAEVPDEQLETASRLVSRAGFLFDLCSLFKSPLRAEGAFLVFRPPVGMGHPKSRISLVSENAFSRETHARKK